MDIPLCPGPLFTRSAGRVTGTSDVWEWQWAQSAMFGYFYPDFMRRYGPDAMVLAEGEYTKLLTGTLADEFLGQMNTEFRREHAAGGALRPDILGFCPKPPRSGPIVLELLEVTTAGQALKTLTEDVQYKLEKFSQIIKGLGPLISEDFSLAGYQVTAVASQWKPRSAYQQIVPLPPRTEQNTTYVEWICFQPTFRINSPNGVDGLLLYEIHSLPVQSTAIPVEVLNRLAQVEKQNRIALRVAYGQTLTPWVTAQYLQQNSSDEQALVALVGVLGLGALILAAVFLWPVVAGVALDVAISASGAAAGADIAVTGAALTESTGELAATVNTGFNLMTTLGRPVVMFAP